MPLFPVGFAPGTHFSPEHSDFVARINALAAGGTVQGVPGVALATRGAPLIILVDPNGDDSESNDGQVVPLKTLAAALKRRPAISDGVAIRLAPGTYPVPNQLIEGGMFDALANNICFGNIGNGLRIEGTMRTIASFKASNITGNVITKDTGAAWTPGAFAGKRCNWIADYFGYPYPQNFWIIDNGDHWLKVAWFSQLMGGYDPYTSLMPVVATTDINVQENASIIEDASGAVDGEWPNVFGADVTFHDLHFKGPRLMAECARTDFYGCRFSHSTYGSIVLTNCNSSFYSCEFDNASSGAFFAGGAAYLNGNVYRTLTAAVYARGTAITADAFAYASAITQPLYNLDVGASFMDWQYGIWLSSVATLYRCKQADYQKGSYGLKQVEAGYVNPTTVYQLQGNGNRLFLGGQTSNFAAQGSTAFIAGPVSSNTHAAFVAASKLFSDNRLNVVSDA